MHRLSETFAQEIDDSKSARSRTALVWDLARLFLQGQQYVSYDRSQGRLRVLDTDDRRYRDDQITPLYRAIVSTLSVEYPSPSILPASPSSEDILKARSSLEAVRYYWATENLKGTYQQLIEWLVSCGNAALHTVYDPDDGAIHTELVNPYDLFFQKGATDPDESAFIAVRRLADRDQLKDDWPKSAKAIDDTPEVKSRDSILEDETVRDNVVEVFDVYYDDGTHEVRLTDHVLDHDEWDTETTPVRMFVYLRVPGVLYGKGLVEDLVDLQILYNKKNQQIIDAIEHYADPYILVPAGSAVPGNAFKIGSSKVVRYNSAHGAPAYMQGTTLPPEAYADLQRIRADMLNVAGVHSATLGQTARGVNSAKHVDALKQSDASQLQPTQAGIEAGTVDVLRTVLVLMREHWTERRWVRALDATGSLIHRELESTDLVEVPEVIIEAGSLFRNETADKRQRIIELHAAGLLQPDEAMQEMAFGTSSRFVLDKIASMSHAGELLNAAKAGFDIQLFPTDDVDVIRRVFEDFMRTADFYGLDLEIQQHVAGLLMAMGGLAAGAPAPGGKGELPQPGQTSGPGVPQVPGLPIAEEPGGQPADARFGSAEVA